MFPSAKKRLLTLNRRGFPPEAPEDVIVQPAYEWILISHSQRRLYLAKGQVMDIFWTTAPLPSKEIHVSDR